MFEKEFQDAKEKYKQKQYCKVKQLLTPILYSNAVTSDVLKLFENNTKKAEKFFLKKARNSRYRGELGDSLIYVRCALSENPLSIKAQKFFKKINQEHNEQLKDYIYIF